MAKRARRSQASPRRPKAVTWQTDLAPVAITLDDTPDARPALLLVMENGSILSGDLVPHPPDDAPGVAAELAQRLTTTAADAGHWPDAIEVRDSDVAVALRVILSSVRGGAGAPDVRAGPLPDVDDALAGFDASVVGRPPEAGQRPRMAHPDTWSGWKRPKAQVARLFTVAARFYRAAPWVYLVNDDVFRVTIPGGATWSVSVMGNAGEVFGIALYAVHEDLLAALSGLEPDEVFTEIEGAILSLTFSPKDDLSPRTRKEVVWERWDVAGPAAWPDLIVVNTPGGGITEHQMDDLIAVMDSVCRFAKANDERLRSSPDEPAILTWTDPESGVSIGFARGIV